ncbi:MAG: hypothetical protein ACYC0M_15630 [Burkholderiales bacterium]
MSFLYPQIVTISRMAALAQTSDGAAQSTSVVASSVPASIQFKRDKGFSAPLGFQAATNSSAPMPNWIIFIALSAVPTLKDGDMVTEAATGQTWKVDAAVYSPLAWRLFCTPYSPDA